MYKTPWEGVEEGRNFPNLAVFAFHQVGKRIFYPVNNLVNILWGLLSPTQSACKMLRTTDWWFGHGPKVPRIEAKEMPFY